MRVHILERQQTVARPLAEVFEFFSNAGNLERITPPWLSFSMIGAPPAEIREGTLISYRLRVHGVPIRWTSRIEAFEQDRLFVDRQVRGPYRTWIHLHTFEADGERTVVRDQVRYALPFGIAGAIAHQLIVRRDLNGIFAHRQAAIRNLLEGPDQLSRTSPREPIREP